jgi:hypothetical protein
MNSANVRTDKMRDLSADFADFRRFFFLVRAAHILNPPKSAKSADRCLALAVGRA